MQKTESLNLASCSDIELHHYLISHYAPSMAQEIYTHANSSDIALLYATTALAELSEYSPCVTRVHDADKLLKEYQHKAVSMDSWSGIVVSVPSTTSFSTLLTHLRQRLLILFTGGRKGILHFYNPRVANYFFDSVEAQDTNHWLGPIKQVSWFAPEHCLNRSLWCKVINTSLPVISTSQVPPLWKMTPSQQTALERLYNDKVLADFFASISLTVTDSEQWSQYLQYMTQSEQLGLSEKEHLYAYLSLCRKFGSADEVMLNSTPLLRLSAPQKIAYLEKMLTKDTIYAR